MPAGGSSRPPHVVADAVGQISRVLSGPPSSADPEGWASHGERLGPLPAGRHASRVIPVLEASGLQGRGGAGFPVGRKWRTVAERSSGRAVVLANGAEGEPLSVKDRVLMQARPHLVLDGAVLAADAVGADRILLYIGHEHRAARVAMARAVGERAKELARRVQIVDAPTGYVSGEESAAVHFVNEGVALPTTVPPRPFERGIGGRSTLVQNVESLAMAALIARFGDDWYRSAGRDQTAGSALVTVSGEVAAQGVYEIELGATVGEVAAGAGGLRGPQQAVLLGGYFGAWAPVEDVWHLPFDPARLRSRGLSFGCGVISFLPASACGVEYSARIMSYMAASSARQCGPCRFGLRAMADATARLAAGDPRPDDLDRLSRWSVQLAGRGACKHPDGASALLRSALGVFAADFAEHQRFHRCSRPRSDWGAA
jgi:NADH:ubiquinone oxidoreductase subunit F (NADH-binding)